MSATVCSRFTTFLCTASLLVSGCQSWSVHTAPLPELLGAKPPDQIRVTTADGARSVMTGPRLAGDSIQTAWRTVAVSDVTRVEVRRVDLPKSIIAGIVVLPGVIGLACVMTACLDLDIGPIFGPPSGGLYRR